MVCRNISLMSALPVDIDVNKLILMRANEDPKRLGSTSNMHIQELSPTHRRLHIGQFSGSTGQGPPFKSDSRSSSHEYSLPFTKPGGSVPWSQEPVTRPHPESHEPNHKERIHDRTLISKNVSWSHRYKYFDVNVHECSTKFNDRKCKSTVTTELFQKSREMEISSLEWHW
jgi:hypothetical protein